MQTIKGPGLFLAQFMGDDVHLILSMPSANGPQD